MEEKIIHPETGEILHRDVHEVEYEYKGEKIKIQQPAWYNDKGDDWILAQEDMKIWGNALRILKARHAEKIQENNLEFESVAFG